jgi:serine/threonine protein kinase
MSAAKQRAKAEEAAKAGKVNAERLHHITKSQKAHTRAPEVVTGQSVESDAEAQEKLDIWGLGIILFGMVFGMAPFGESPATKEDFEQASNDTYKNAWAGESGYEESAQVPPAVKDAYKEDGASGAYGDLKELVDNMLKQKVEERWSLSQVATKLDLQIPKRLSEWLKETHTHEGAEIAAIYAEFFEPMQAKCGGDIDISELKAKMPSDQLDEVIATSGKKSPVQKKLFTRLHFELRYPLNDKQAKKIKVTPHAEEGVPKKP